MITKLQLVECTRQKSFRHPGLGEIFTIEETNKVEENEEEEGGERKEKEEEEKEKKKKLSS